MNDEIKEIFEALKESYDETIPKREFNWYLKYIEEYITNLQQENEEIEELKADNQDLKFEISLWKKLTDKINETNKYLNVKIKKAIEYINNNPLYSEDYDYDEEDNLVWQGARCDEQSEDLLNILNGSDK